MTATKLKLRTSVWTPYGMVLCYKCHGPEFNRGFGEQRILTVEEMAWHEEQREVFDGQHMTTCNKCNRAIQAYDEVAEENNLAEAIKRRGIRAHLTQTGGMNSACEVPIKFEGELDEHQERPYYMLKWTYEPREQELDEYFSISKFDENGEWIEDDNLDSQSFTSPEEAAEFVGLLPDVIWL